jgi:hypothetical protein
MSAHTFTPRLAVLAVAVATLAQLGVSFSVAGSAFAADGLGADSSSGGGCGAGYYYCWSNVQQKPVCTTRKCY